LNLFFFKFHPLSICWLRIELHNLFWFILYGLSQPHKLNRKFDKLIQADSDCFFWYVFYEVFSIHDSGHEFDRLTRVDSGHFFSIFFLIDIFSNFILQHWIDWELYFMIYFNLLSIRLSLSYSLDCGFHKLIELTSVIFCYFF